MAKRAKKKTDSNGTAANLGFEEKLWQAADKLRKSVDAAEYKHVVLGLIFLKYVSDAFTDLHDRLDEDEREDRDYYVAENVFWVPPEARWSHLQASAKQADIGKRVDDAMLAIERDNPKRLKGALPKEYARRAADGVELGELIDVIGTIALGDEASKSKDILGRCTSCRSGQNGTSAGEVLGLLVCDTLKREERASRLRQHGPPDRVNSNHRAGQSGKDSLPHSSTHSSRISWSLRTTVRNEQCSSAAISSCE